MQLQENTLFANRYMLERMLGRGGFSEVWLAKDNWTHLRIALKVYAPGQGMDANGLQDFCGELANVFDLNHSNLLKPTHVDSWNDMPYLIMAYCSQGSLSKKLCAMTEEQIWKMLHDVASGLAYLHDKEVVHQDIKPDNILLDEFNNYVITDFGISTRARSTLRKSVVGGSTSGGTTAYMGPERFSRQPAPTKASDIWSLGATVFELIEGTVPFGEIGGGLQKGGAEIPMITASVSDALKFSVMKMLSKETWDRPTAKTLVEWASDPSKIVIDYSLISDQGQSADQGKTSGDEQVSSETIISGEEIKPARETMIFGQSGAQPFSSLSVSPSSISVAAEGYRASKIDVLCNSEWTATTSNDAKWLHVKKDSSNTISVWGDPNKTSDARSAHVYIHCGEDVKSVRVTQAQKPKSSKAWVWVLLAVFMITVIGVVVGVELDEQRRQEEIYVSNRHQEAVNEFERYRKAASLDNIDALESANTYLKSIKNWESDKSFTGTPVYANKRNSLKSKASDLYNKADEKYRKAPANTGLKSSNLNKRDRIEAIKKKI